MFGKSRSQKLVFDEKKLKKPAQPQAATSAASTTEAAQVAHPVPKLTMTNNPAMQPKGKKQPKPPKSGQRVRVPLFRNKKAMGILLICTSLVITLGVNPALNYFNTQQTVTAVVANVDIERGTEITKEMLSEVTHSATALLPVQLLSSADVIGKYATSHIVTGEIVSQPKLAATIPHSNAYLYTLPEGKKAISVSVAKLSSSISGKLEQGDIVSVYVPLANDSNNIRDYAEQPPELTYVEVLSCTNVDGVDITVAPDKSTLSNPLPVTVTLAVDDTQAVILAGSEIQGGVHLALVSRGDKLMATELLNLQAAFNLDIVASAKKAEEGVADEK